MPNLGKPNLILVLPSPGKPGSTWILEPQGRNTFKIVIVCAPDNPSEAHGDPHASAA